MKNIKELSLDEIKVLYRDHLKAQGYKRHTIMTSGSEAFYLWQHGNKELFWMTVLSHDFENSAREALLKYLRQDSKGDTLLLVFRKSYSRLFEKMYGKLERDLS